ncbi:MAG: 4Fe-4S dicluster domain-containing protein [Bacillota bacterium]
MLRKQLGFLFDTNRCLGCRTCITACAEEKGLPIGVYLRNVELHELRKGAQIIKYYLSTACNHCSNPECFRLCPEHALRKRRDGIVLLNEERCTGCGICVRGCPFKGVAMNTLTGKAVKCDLCQEKLDEKKLPVCVAACPVEALRLIDISEVESRNLDIVRRLPGVAKIQITRPAIRYLPLRYGKQVLRL